MRLRRRAQGGPLTVAAGVAVLISLCSSTLGLAQSSGIIGTKPACFPSYGQVYGSPPFHTFADLYVEGPDPVRLDNGDVVIHVDAVAGLFNQGVSSEALMALVFPNSTSVPARWYPVYATNVWGTAPAQKEAEGAFPVFRYFHNAWRLFYTSTLEYASRPLPSCFPPQNPPVACSDNYHRTGLINLLNPSLQPSFRDQWWLQPIVAACQNSGVPPPPSTWGGTTWATTCPGSGSGFDEAVVGSDGLPYIYHFDGNYPDCATRYVRHRINPDMSYTFAGCVTGAPGQVTDITFGNDGLYHLLGNRTSPYPIPSEGFSEYTSSDGLAFVSSPTGARYAVDCATLGLESNCFVAGVSHLKDKSGRLIQPRVAVGVVGNRHCTPSPCAPGTDGSGNPLTNDWRLHYWADAGASLPPTWGSAAYSCPAPTIVAGAAPSYGGNLDSASCATITGWAWDWYNPNASVSVDLFADGSLFATVQAGTYRGDLASPASPYFWYGNGLHAFEHPLPRSLLNGAPHVISAKYAGTNIEVANSPRSVSCTSLFQGNHDSSTCFEARGWAWDATQPNAHIPVRIEVDGLLVATATAEEFRPDLLAAGFGDGSHGFRAAMPAWVRDGAGHVVTVRYAENSAVTTNSPKTIGCQGARFFPVAPCRLVDTRLPDGPSGGPSLSASASREFPISGVCGVAGSARAVALNVTASDGTAAGSLGVFPGGMLAPGTSSVSYRAGQVRASNGIFGIGEGGQLGVRCLQPAGSVNVILDVVGYFQ